MFLVQYSSPLNAYLQLFIATGFVTTWSKSSYCMQIKCSCKLKETLTSSSTYNAYHPIKNGKWYIALLQLLLHMP